MKKIIFITYARTHNNMIQRFYLDVLYKNNIDIEYWDIRSIYFEENDEYEFDFIYKIKSLQDLRMKLAKLNPEEVIINLQFAYEYKFLNLFYMCRHFTLSTFSIGNFSHFSSTETHFLQALKKVFSKRLYEKLIEILFYKCFLKPFDICFYAGEYSQHIVAAKKYLPVNFLDYEIQKKVSTFKTSSKYALFLDLNLLHHPDFKDIGLDYIDKDTYIDQMKKMFKSIKNNLGLDVIIALHPTSSKYKFHPQDLQYKNLTHELVQGCEFAITHYSTSIYSVVSAHKPLILCYSKDIRTKIPYSASLIHGLSNLLDVAVIDIGDDYQIKGIPTINEKKYDTCLKNYCTSKDTENLFANEYLVEYIKTL